MTIELKLSPDELEYLSARLEAANKVTDAQFLALPYDRRVIVSIYLDLTETLKSKYNGVAKKNSLFDQNKKYKLSLKYHELYAIAAFVQGAKNLETDPYRRNIAEKMHLMFDQKLK